MNRKTCNLFIEQDDIEEYLIEYRGNLLEQMENIDYACVFKITNKLALLAVKGDRLTELKKEVLAIIFVNFRNKYVLEGTSVSDVSNIRPIKINPYLFLTGRGVIIGIVDTGIDYTNKEFLRENNTSRIEVIWDQTINSPDSDANSNEVFTGIEYLKNYALKVRKPIIILNSIGTSEHSHDSSDIFSRYLSEIASYRGLVFVALIILLDYRFLFYHFQISNLVLGK